MAVNAVQAMESEMARMKTAAERHDGAHIPLVSNLVAMICYAPDISCASYRSYIRLTLLVLCCST